jgi:microcystin-dependent protein
MTQYDFGTIDVVNTNGTELAAIIQNFRNAVETMHAGSSRPAYAQNGTRWLDTSGATYLEKYFDGTDDIVTGTFDPVTNKYYPNLTDWTAEVTIASATTTDILAAATNRVVVSGTNTITSFGTKINQVKFVRFTGALSINNGSAIVTPDGANIAITAGQTIIVISDATGVARIWSAPSSGVAAGMVCTFPTTSAPLGYLKANGAAVSRTAYAGLFAAIGTTFGVGDGSTTFNVPDLRGEFIRGLDDGRGVDASRTLGSAQANLLGSHTHGVSDPTHAHGVGDPGHGHGATATITKVSVGGGSTLSSVWHDRGPGSDTGAVVVNGAGTGIWIGAAGTGISIAAAGGAETRPRNVALLFCIKY